MTLKVRVDDAHSLLSAFGMLVSTNDAVFAFGEDLAMSANRGSGPADAMGAEATMGGAGSTGDAGSMAGSDGTGSTDSMAGSGAMAGSDGMAGSGSMGGSDGMRGSDSMAGSGAMAGSGSMPGSEGMTAAGDGAGTDLYDGSVRVLDAGSEANTESCRDIPGPPCNHPGVRHPAMAEGAVTIHPGLKGAGDLDPAVYGLTDPVASVRVTTP